MNILIGITAGIAAVKIPDLIKGLHSHGHTVKIIMTPSAMRIISIEQIKMETGVDVSTELFPPTYSSEHILATRSVEHIEMVKWADVLVIVPATANSMGKFAHGLADDYLSTVVLAFDKPILMYPSMNTNMWFHPAVQKNIFTLKSYGMHIIDPVDGELACGTHGTGRLPSIPDIITTIEQTICSSNELSAYSVLVTAGSTKEYIDSVRYMSNRSSGKMGAALALACHTQGAQVTLLSNRYDVNLPRGIKQHTYETFEQLEGLMRTYVPASRIIIHVAAVTDFKTDPHQGKIDSTVETDIHIRPQKKILNEIKKWSPECFLAGFKATYGIDNTKFDQITNDYFDHSDADMMIVNDVSRADIGFESDDNEVHIYSKNAKPVTIPKMTKREVAQKIITIIKSRLPKIL